MKHSFTFFGAVGLTLALACGGGKPADDPSTEHTGAGDGADPAATETPTTTPPKPQPTATEDTSPKVPYDAEAVQIGLNRAARQVKDNCGAVKDDQGKANGPWGKTIVTVQLGHNGHSRGTTLKSPFDGTGVGRCINSAFSNLVYPPFSGADTTVDCEVELSHPDNMKK